MLNTKNRIRRRALTIIAASMIIGLCFQPARAQIVTSIGKAPELPKPGMAGEPQHVFERPLIDFLTQGIGQENCVNVPLTNRSTKPAVLTLLVSRDPKHFRINSPASEMMPMTLEPNSSVYVNICFKADREREFRSSIRAILGGDTLTLALVGRGVKQKAVGPLPQKLALKILRTRHKFDKTFSIELPTRSTVTLEITDILGKSVRKLLLNELKSPGEYQVNFNWKDDAQNPLHAGIYVVRLEAASIETHQTDHVSEQIVLKQ